MFNQCCLKILPQDVTHESVHRAQILVSFSSVCPQNITFIFSIYFQLNNRRQYILIRITWRVEVLCTQMNRITKTTHFYSILADCIFTAIKLFTIVVIHLEAF